MRIKMISKMSMQNEEEKLIRIYNKKITKLIFFKKTKQAAIFVRIKTYNFSFWEQF